MRRLSRLLVTALLLYAGCTDTAVNTGGAGEVRFRVFNLPGDLATLTATLSTTGDTARTLTITAFDTAGFATGTFHSVPAGVWRLAIDGTDTAGLVRYGALFFVEVFDFEISSVVGELTTALGECALVPEGLVSWWTGDRTTRDRTGGNHPVWLNWVDSTAPAFVGEGLYFNGIDSHMPLGDPENLKLTGSLTIEGWIYVSSSPPGRIAAQIFFRGDDRPGIDPYYLAVMPSGRFRFHISSGSTDVELETPATYGRWLHIAATLNDTSGVMTLYIDGEPEASLTTAVRPFRDLEPALTPGVGIGNTQTLGLVADQHPFHGFIDELAVYNRCLSRQEVLLLFRAGEFGKCKF